MSTGASSSEALTRRFSSVALRQDTEDEALHGGVDARDLNRFFQGIGIAVVSLLTIATPMRFRVGVEPVRRRRRLCSKGLVCLVEST